MYTITTNHAITNAHMLYIVQSYQLSPFYPTPEHLLAHVKTHEPVIDATILNRAYMHTNQDTSYRTVFICTPVIQGVIQWVRSFYTAHANLPDYCTAEANNLPLSSVQVRTYTAPTPSTRMRKRPLHTEPKAPIAEERQIAHIKAENALYDLQLSTQREHRRKQRKQRNKSVASRTWKNNRRIRAQYEKNDYRTCAVSKAHSLPADDKVYCKARYNQTAYAYIQLANLY